jgi:hypothetical protein
MINFGNDFGERGLDLSTGRGVWGWGVGWGIGLGHGSNLSMGGQHNDDLVMELQHLILQLHSLTRLVKKLIYIYIK